MASVKTLSQLEDNPGKRGVCVNTSTPYACEATLRRRPDRPTMTTPKAKPSHVVAVVTHVLPATGLAYLSGHDGRSWAGQSDRTRCCAVHDMEVSRL